MREARRQKDLTQKELGDLVGVTEDSVGAWETRDVVPRDPVKRAVAAALGKTFEWLNGEPDAAPESAGTFRELAVREGYRVYTQVPGKRLPPKAYELVYSYTKKLEAAGLDVAEIEEAERFLIDGAYNKLNARDPGQKSEEDLILDINAAWQFVRDVVRRSGKKL